MGTTVELIHVQMWCLWTPLRACSKSFEQQRQERQVDELQAGVEQPLAVLPQPPVLLQPRKAALHYPALGHHFERMQFASLCDLHVNMLAQYLSHALGERSAYVAAVTQHNLHPTQRSFAVLQCLQGPFAVRYLCRGYRNSMRQSLGIHCNVALNARNLLARVIAFVGRRVRILHALRVHDQERA